MGKLKNINHLVTLVIFTIFFLVFITGILAEEALLRPGVIAGKIKVGAEIINSASISANWSGYSAETLISPNKNVGNYHLTVNAPAGASPEYKITAGVYFNNNRYGLFFGPKKVPVTGNVTSAADFILDAPGIIQGNVTVRGGSLSNFTLKAYQASETVLTDSRQYYSSNGSFRLPVVPNNNIKVNGFAYVNGSALKLAPQYIGVAAGQTVNLNWTIDYTPPQLSNISGIINLKGSLLAKQHHLYVTGPENKGLYLSGNGAFTFSNLKPGNYKIDAYSYFNNDDDTFYYPDYFISPAKTINLGGGQTASINITAKEAFINGKLNLVSKRPLLDASSAEICFKGVSNTDTQGGSSKDQINRQNGNFDLIVSAGDWEMDYLKVNFQDTRTESYLMENLTFYDYRQPPLSLAATQTATCNLNYRTGIVTVIFRVSDGTLLSNPCLTGNCVKPNLTGGKDWAYTVTSSGNQQNVQKAKVTFLGMEGLSTLDAKATVNGSTVTFGRLTVNVIPGADQMVDLDGPAQVVESPVPESLTNAGRIVVSGRATDDTGLASITVNGIQSVLSSANNPYDPREMQFNANISLVKGANLIRTVVIDNTGKTSTDTRTIYWDEGPPRLTWTPVDGTTVSTSEITVQGTATDDLGIKTITCNGTLVNFISTNNPADPNEVSFSAALTLQEGNNNLEVTATDQYNQSTVEIHRIDWINNQPPAVNAGPDAIIDQETAFTANGDFTDPDSNTWTATVDYGDGSGVQALPFNPDRKFTLSHIYVTNGVYNVTVSVSDSHGGVGTDTLAVTVKKVNHAPVLEVIINKTVNEGEFLEFIVNATDSDGDRLTYAAENLPPGAGFNPVTRTFGWTPDFNQSGTYQTLRFTVTDGSLTAAQDVKITVNDVNISPFLVKELQVNGNVQIDQAFSNGLVTVAGNSRFKYLGTTKSSIIKSRNAKITSLQTNQPFQPFPQVDWEALSNLTALRAETTLTPVDGTLTNVRFEKDVAILGKARLAGLLIVKGNLLMIGNVEWQNVGIFCTGKITIIGNAKISGLIYAGAGLRTAGGPNLTGKIIVKGPAFIVGNLVYHSTPSSQTYDDWLQ